MSRHRAIRNLNLEEAKLLKGIEVVKGAIGSDTGIEDKEIKESLWYYYFDTDATVAWLQSKIR
ncbi:hypothetical protein EV174_003042 [Coemansia sp. RSA 2320]|nr:hypothetical protein EV174_003042 [Coemansia sp. RSA 2320]